MSVREGGRREGRREGEKENKGEENERERGRGRGGGRRREGPESEFVWCKFPVLVPMLQIPA